MSAGIHALTPPPPIKCCAGGVAEWAVSACESLSDLHAAPAARALLHLALRGRAAACQPPAPRAGGAAAAGSEGQWGDLDLMLAVATDIRGMLETGGCRAGAQVVGHVRPLAA